MIIDKVKRVNINVDGCILTFMGVYFSAIVLICGNGPHYKFIGVALGLFIVMLGVLDLCRLPRKSNKPDIHA